MLFTKDCLDDQHSHYRSRPSAKLYFTPRFEVIRMVNIVLQISLGSLHGILLDSRPLKVHFKMINSNQAVSSVRIINFLLLSFALDLLSISL